MYLKSSSRVINRLQESLISVFKQNMFGFLKREIGYFLRIFLRFLCVFICRDKPRSISKL